MNESFWRHGNGGSKRHNGSRRALLCAAAVLGGLALAACGSVQASGSGAGAGQTSPAPSAGASGSPGTASGGSGPAQPVLCRDAATVTRLIITRVHSFKVPELQPAFPNQVTVTNPALVRAVARALCALPDMPRGVFSCPALLLGTTYTLRFAVDGRPLPMVTINQTGCETVTGVGPVRRVTSPAFWRVLAQAIGVKPPLPPVFGGNGRMSVCQPPSPRITKVDGCPGLARPGTVVAEPAGAAAP
jgi:hypothetical protein